MADRKSRAIRILRVKKSDDLKTIYAKAHEAFTAADLQRFTEVEQGIPAEEVLAKLEVMAGVKPRKRRKT